MRFDGQVVVITGAGRGLGRAHALEFARRGAAVVVNDVGGSVDGQGSNPAVADEVVAEIEGLGGRAVATAHSVASVDGGQHIIDTAIEAFGRVDALVNNAGIMIPGRFGDIGVEALDAIIDVHLKGAFHVTQPAFRAMRDQGYGRIVFTGSSAGVFGARELAAYGAAKAGLLGLARVVALEGAESGVLINTVLPMGRTRMGPASPVVEREVPPEHERGRLAFLESIRPELVSPLVAYLASMQCAVTGGVFSAAGRGYARVFTGLTRGWVAAEDAVEAENIGDHFAQVEDLAGYSIPDSTAAELATLMGRLADAD
ncbi:MAG: hypothetical protein QOK05_296 [Chloroflexota bacterium]|nr:hypothetical protein [Chloroflexota bacterium]